MILLDLIFLHKTRESLRPASYPRCSARNTQCQKHLLRVWCCYFRSRENDELATGSPTFPLVLAWPCLKTPFFCPAIYLLSFVSLQQIATVYPLFWVGSVGLIAFIEGQTIKDAWGSVSPVTGVGNLKEEYYPGDLGFDPLGEKRFRECGVRVVYGTSQICVPCALLGTAASGGSSFILTTFCHQLFFGYTHASLIYLFFFSGVLLCLRCRDSRKKAWRRRTGKTSA